MSLSCQSRVPVLYCSCSAQGLADGHGAPDGGDVERGLPHLVLLEVPRITVGQRDGCPLTLDSHR